MNFHVDNLIYLLLGCLIGGVFGYMVRDLKDIKEKVGEVDEMVKKTDGRGAVSRRYVNTLALIAVILLTAWAAVASQLASNRSENAVVQVQESNAHLARVVKCNNLITSKLLKAVNERVETSTKSSQANVDLQQAWYRFVKFQLHLPPYPENERRDRANIYAERLHEFLEAWNATKAKQAENPYPEDGELSRCIDQARTKR